MRSVAGVVSSSAVSCSMSVCTAKQLMARGPAASGVEQLCKAVHHANKALPAGAGLQAW